MFFAKYSPTFKALCIISLCLVTVWFYNYYPRYQAVGNNMLENAEFQRGLEFWITSRHGVSVIPGLGVRLAHEGAKGMVVASQSIASAVPGALLSLGCDIKTIDVVVGKEDWQIGRIVLLTYDNSHAVLYNRPHVLVQQTGSHDWRHVAKVFAIGSDAVKVEVAAQMAGISGELWLRSCNLHPVALKLAFREYRFALLCLWLAVAVWIVRPFFRSTIQTGSHALVSMLVIGIFVGVLMPQELKQTMRTAIEPAGTPGITSVVGFEALDFQRFNFALELPAIDVFKIGHFVLFAALVWVLFAARPYRIPAARLVFYPVLLAVVTEILQLFMIGRTAQLGDVFIDCGGIAWGLMLFWVWRLFRRV